MQKAADTWNDSNSRQLLLAVMDQVIFGEGMVKIDENGNAEHVPYPFEELINE